MDIKVSIIIVNYNNFHLINDCIASVIKYTKNITYEIIVIDNNSNENVEIVANKFNNIKLIKNNTNKGFAAANNQGIKIAKGKYILFLNNDTIFFENSIKNVFEFAELQNQSIMVGCRLLNLDGSFQESVMNFPSIWNTITDSFFLSKIFRKSTLFNKNAYSFRNLNSPIEVDVIKGAFMFCNSNSVKKLNMFDERFFFYSEELDLCYRFKLNGRKVYYYPFTSIIHIGGATVRKKEKFFYKNQFIARIQFYQKHFKGLRFTIIVLAYIFGVLIRVPLYFIFGFFSLNKNYIKKSGYYIYQLSNYPKNLFANDK